jgi:hypothetical protein
MEIGAGMTFLEVALKIKKPDHTKSIGNDQASLLIFRLLPPKEANYKIS